MKKKNILRLMVISAFLLLCPFRIADAGHPAQDIMSFYDGELPNRNTVEPYIVSILALNEVEGGRHFAEVQRFILWYFSKLNYPDHHGLTGTIYVYTLEGGQERSTQRYDSVDGYSGLFLHLLHRYVVKTGDLELIRANWNKIEDIAYTLPALQDKDGLTRALPDSRVKYLMDNCEVYGGLSDYLQLRKLAGKGPSEYYSRVRDSVRNGIFAALYDPRHRLFAWAVENNEKSRSSWKVFYPDAYAQLFPIYYDLLKDRPDMQRRLWRTFSRRYAGKEGTFPVEQRIIYNLTRVKMGDMVADDK